MDKNHFLQIIQMARKNAENIHNITSAWERSGLFPGNPQLIIQKLGLEKLKTRPITPPDITLRGSDGKSISLSLRTSVNIKDVDQILEKIKKDENDDDFTLIDKLGKACSSAIANLLLAQETNNDLIKIDKRKKDKVSHSIAHLNQGQIMNLEVVQQ